MTPGSFACSFIFSKQLSLLINSYYSHRANKMLCIFVVVAKVDRILEVRTSTTKTYMLKYDRCWWWQTFPSYKDGVWSEKCGFHKRRLVVQQYIWKRGTKQAYQLSLMETIFANCEIQTLLKTWSVLSRFFPKAFSFCSSFSAKSDFFLLLLHQCRHMWSEQCLDGILMGKPCPSHETEEATDIPFGSLDEKLWQSMHLKH